MGPLQVVKWPRHPSLDNDATNRGSSETGLGAVEDVAYAEIPSSIGTDIHPLSLVALGILRVWFFAPLKSFTAGCLVAGVAGLWLALPRGSLSGSVVVRVLEDPPQ